MEQKKKALGRGLEQLFDSEILDFDSFESNIMNSVTDKDITEINLSDIRPNPYQPRKSFNEDALKELAESIKNYGVIQPIIVKKSIKGYDLIAGERRVRASIIAGVKSIPAIVKDLSDDKMREIALLENLQREDLTAIELAWAYKGIIDSMHITQEELSEKIGKSRSNVTNTLGLLRLPDEVQKLILDGKISMGHARELSKINDIDTINLMAKKIVDDGLTVRDIENEIKKEETPKARPINRSKKVNDYDYLEKELEEVIGSKVRIRDNKLVISFANGNDLNRILEIMQIKIN